MRSKRNGTSKTTLVAFLLAASLVAVGVPAAATHDDPTHGVAPHSLGDDPTGIHATNVSTPHPYEDGEVYTWEVEIDDVHEAGNISLHFENVDLDGGMSWTGECNGDWLNITDADTGEQLDAWCGSDNPTPYYDDQFWTDFYETDHVIVSLDTTEDDGVGYGFDVYEAATDGTESVYSVPVNWGDEVNTYTEISKISARADTNPFADDPTQGTAVRAFALFTAHVQGLSTKPLVEVEVGEWEHCQGWMDCHTHKGVHTQVTLDSLKTGDWLPSVSAADEDIYDGETEATIDVGLVEDEESPIGFTLHEPECTIDGQDCTSYMPAPPG